MVLRVCLRFLLSPFLQRRPLYRCTDTSALEGARALRPDSHQKGVRGRRVSLTRYQLARYGVVQGPGHAIILRAPPNRAENAGA